MMNYNGGPIFKAAAAIPSGESQSNSITLAGAALVGLYTDATNWTSSASITFLACDTEDGTFRPVRGADGQEVSVSGFSNGDYIMFPAGAFHGIKYLKLRSGTAGSPVNQAALRNLVVIARSFQ